MYWILLPIGILVGFIVYLFIAPKCKHEWEEKMHNTIYGDNYYKNHDALPKGDRWTYVCKKCLKTKIISNY